jgi:hypothetical protein
VSLRATRKSRNESRGEGGSLVDNELVVITTRHLRGGHLASVFGTGVFFRYTSLIYIAERRRMGDTGQTDKSKHERLILPSSPIFLYCRVFTVRYYQNKQQESGHCSILKLVLLSFLDRQIIVK